MTRIGYGLVDQRVFWGLDHEVAPLDITEVA
jgi:hypothetical protein